MIPDLYELVCKQCGIEHEDCIVPCVVDLVHHTCNYAVKHKGIRIIKNKDFGENLNLSGNTHFLEPVRDINPEDSLWELWQELHHPFAGADRKTRHVLNFLSEREALIVGDVLYLKWDQRGICQTIELDTESKIARVKSIVDWFYPQTQPIGKKTIQKIEEHITSYYTK